MVQGSYRFVLQALDPDHGSPILETLFSVTISKIHAPYSVRAQTTLRSCQEPSSVRGHSLRVLHVEGEEWCIAAWKLIREAAQKSG